MKRALARSVLLQMSDLTSDDLSEGALAFLIGDLRAASIHLFTGNLLVRIATDTFIVQRVRADECDASGILHLAVAALRSISRSKVLQ